jgi:hypothetical protein
VGVVAGEDLGLVVEMLAQVLYLSKIKNVQNILAIVIYDFHGGFGTIYKRWRL